MKNQTFSFNATIKRGDVPGYVMDESMWSSDMAVIFFGFCHTFRYPHKILADQYTTMNSSYFYLDPSINYRIVIHDPKFYHMLIKNGIFPRIMLQYKSGHNLESGHFDYYEITVTEHHLLNRPEQPCEEEEDYDFLECVKTSQARMAGVDLPGTPGVPTPSLSVRHWTSWTNTR